MSTADWFKLLELARGLSPKPKDTFTVKDLARKAGWSGDEVRIASGWLYKFRKWGYVNVVGTEPGGAVRPLNVFVVTEKGHQCKPRAGREVQLKTLLEAIDGLRAVRGTKAEQKAIQRVIDLGAEIQGSLK
jgi:hypothetical protein